MYRIHSCGDLGERVDFRASAFWAFQWARHLVAIGRTKVHVLDPCGSHIAAGAWEGSRETSKVPGFVPANG